MARLVIAAALLLAVGASASLVLLPPKLGESEPSGGSWAQHSCSGTAEACSLAALTPGALNIITPVDAPPCARGAPFRFQVLPRSNTSVMIYFNGQGVCWDEATCFDIVRLNASVPTLPAALDALETFTLVVVNSCTGDFLLGDAERTFGAHRFTFNGRAHAQLVLDWVRTNLPAPDDVILAGTAGGALGALVHADAVATMYPAARLSLVSDSFVAAQPPQFHGVYSDVWGACDAIPAALPDVRSDCQAGRPLDAQAIAISFMTRFPAARFLLITSAHDVQQVALFALQRGSAVPLQQARTADAMGTAALATLEEEPVYLQARHAWADAAQAVIGQYLEHANFRMYYVAGAPLFSDWHGFLPYDTSITPAIVGSSSVLQFVVSRHIGGADAQDACGPSADACAAFFECSAPADAVAACETQRGPWAFTCRTDGAPLRVACPPGRVYRSDWQVCVATCP